MIKNRKFVAGLLASVCISGCTSYHVVGANNHKTAHVIEGNANAFGQVRGSRMLVCNAENPQQPVCETAEIANGK